MEFYLSQYTGDGSRGNEFRPSGSDQDGWSAIDMRPDSTVQAGRAFVAMPTRADAADRTYLGNSPDDISAALVSAINSRFGLTLDPTENTLRVIVFALLTKYATGGRWKPILPVGGRWEVWLGGLFVNLPVTAGGAGVIDDFNRADGALGSPWVLMTNTTFNGAGMTVVSNQAKASGVTNAVDGNRVPLDTVNHVCIADATVNGDFVDVNVRVATATTGGDFDRYIGRLNAGSTGDQIYKNVTGTGTVIGSQAHTISSGNTDTLTLSVDGTSLRFTTSAGTISITDSAVTTGTAAAIVTYTSVSTAGIFDNFFAYDLHQPSKLQFRDPYQVRWRDSTPTAIRQNLDRLNRRRSIELGVADQDTTLRPNYSPANPYQLRWRDSTAMARSATAQFMRHTLNSNDLGVADQDVTLRPPWQGSPTLRWRDLGTAYVQAYRAWDEDRRSGTELDVTAPDADPTVTLLPWRAMNPYQLRWRDSAVTAVEATRQWFADRLTSNDLGVADQDTTIRPLWAAANPYQLRWRDSAVDAVEAQEGWLRRTLNSNDLGVGDQDVSLRPVWAAANPYQIRWRDTTVDAVEAQTGWLRRTLNSNDLGQADADPTVKPPWAAANPYQLRWRPSTTQAVEASEVWFRRTLNSNDLGVADQDTMLRPTWQSANPYQLRRPPNDGPAITAWFAQLRLWEMTVPAPPAADADPTLVVRRPQNPYQLWVRRVTTGQHPVLFVPDQPVADADPLVHRTFQHPHQLWRREVLIRFRPPGLPGAPAPAAPGGSAVTVGGSGLIIVTAAGTGSTTATPAAASSASAATSASRESAESSVTPTSDGSASSTASET